MYHPHSREKKKVSSAKQCLHWGNLNLRLGQRWKQGLLFMSEKLKFMNRSRTSRLLKEETSLLGSLRFIITPFRSKHWEKVARCDLDIVETRVQNMLML
jgi:hypothetical protein